MLTVAYLANQFPAAVEPYVGEEIEELRRRGVRVVPGSGRRPDGGTANGAFSAAMEPEILYLEPVRVLTLLRALGLAVRRWERISGLIARVLLQGQESPKQRLKALLHTWLGAYYAVLLREREVDHVHVHHGYFGSWVGMVAARLLGVNFSMTLHGSDLLLNGGYLDTKLRCCRFCVTVSEYNRGYILEHFPAVDPRKIVISRLGVDAPEQAESRRVARGTRRVFTLLAVGRLHAVKDHAFLVRACARLRDGGLDFECWIAGEGPERRRLETLIRENRLQDQIKLLGHVAGPQLDALYWRADVAVLTSRSEGIPLVLMEAMVRGRIVLAPAITGIPEIVVHGKTGFLYAAGALSGFVAKILFLERLMCGEDRSAVSRLDWIRHAAQMQVAHNFSRGKNLTRFGSWFLQRIATPDFPPTQDFVNQDFVTQDWSAPRENLVLQQI